MEAVPVTETLVSQFELSNTNTMLNRRVSLTLGSGLVFQRNNRWVLGGIVSAGLSDANSGACKLTDYVVFTDISQYTSWILSYLHI